MKFWLRRLKIKAWNWEYWPMYMVYFLPGIYYLWLSIKARSLLFFSVTNPLMENGGMFFDSKWQIYQQIPKAYLPITIYIPEKSPINQIIEQIEQANLNFPIIAKPNKGERGLGVKKLHSKDELIEYINQTKVDFILQEFIDFPLEYSFFYIRKPGEGKGRITSLTRKDLLTVVGDGKLSIEELILKDDRAFLQIGKLQLDSNFKTKVLAQGEQQLLVPYGNHCRGAKFVDCSHLIDDKLVDMFDNISKQINRFYYGRFDIKTTSLDDVKAGRNISILELNGAKAEVAHIYQPGFSFFKAQRIIFQHFSWMWEIAMLNKAEFKILSLSDFFRLRKLEREYKSRIQQ